MPKVKKVPVIKDSAYATSFILTIQKEDWDPTPYFEYKSIRHISGQKEIGKKTEKPHWQVFVQLRKSQQFYKIRKMFEPHHVEASRYPQKCYEYCRKVDTAIPDTYFSHGKPCFKAGSRTDLESCYDAAKEHGLVAVAGTDTYIRYHRGIDHSLNLCPPPYRENIRVFYIYGKSGWGKTNRLRWNNACEITDNHQQWFGNYAGQPCIRFNEFLGKLNADTLLSVCSHDPVSLPVKGRIVPCQANVIVFTSNQPPTDFFTGPAWERRMAEPWFLTIKVDDKTLGEVADSITRHLAYSPTEKFDFKVFDPN